MKIKKKPFFIVSLILTMVVIDLIKFLIVGKPTIINWNSFVHPFWVLFAVTGLGIATFVDKPLVWRSFFRLHLVIFFGAYLNHYLSFTTILTYQCMLFNAIFATAHYLSYGRKQA